MNKGDYLTQLFDDIKDSVELDSDVLALESLLFLMLDENLEDSVAKWQYLILKYDLQSAIVDIDFTPILKEYPNSLLKRVGVESFFSYMNVIPDDKARIIYSNVFNIYDSDCFIYQTLDSYIKKNNYQEERKLIQLFLNKSDNFFKGVFDKTEFIRRVILIHIAYNHLSHSFFQELICNLDSKKDQAVLKTMLINYLRI